MTLNAKPPRLRLTTLCLVAYGLLFGISGRSTMAAGLDPEGAKPRVKFGFTKSMFMDLNEGDTRAAVKSYAILLASNNDLTVSDLPGVLDNAEAVKEAFDHGTADVIAMTTVEYFSLPEGSTNPRMITANMSGSFNEQYVLLVRSDSGIQTLADLQHKRLLIYSSLRGFASPLWIDVLLATNGMPEPNDFFSSVTSVTKPSRTVLPVFFKQADACVVTLAGFKVLSEMNPQIAKQLSILATSPTLTPTVTCFRSGISPDIAERLMKAMTNVQYNVAGRQVLTIFQCDNIVEISPSNIENVRELLVTQARLRKRPLPLGISSDKAEPPDPSQNP